MALAQTEALLARLLTDAGLREAFFDAPVDVGRRFGMNETQARMFATIDRGEVEAFARSLHGKRALDLRKLMPRTARALETKFDAAMMDMVAAPHGADAHVFVKQVAKMSAKGECAAYVVDIARFELAFIEAARPGVWLRRFEHDIVSVVSAPDSGAPVGAARRPTLGVWLRLPGARLRWRLFPFPARQTRR